MAAIKAGGTTAASGPGGAGPSGGMERHGGKVLVVEDVALIRLTIMDMVEQLGFEALAAGDAQEALALLRQDSGVTVLLTDLGLPGMDGRQLVEEALRLKPDLKVIIASGYSIPEQERMASGGPRYLIKPFDMTQLGQALQA